MSTVPPNVDEVVDPEPDNGKSRGVLIERLFREHNEATESIVRKYVVRAVLHCRERID